jgi:translation initiation factor IF-2
MPEVPPVVVPPVAEAAAPVAAAPAAAGAKTAPAAPPVAKSPVVKPPQPAPPAEVEIGVATRELRQMPPARAPGRRTDITPSSVRAPARPEVRGPKILGRIDLSKTAPPPPPTRDARTVRDRGRRDGMPEPGAPPQQQAMPPVAPAADGKRKKGKKRRVIKNTESFDVRDDQRRSRVPRKRRALPGKEQRKTEITTPAEHKRVVRISEVVTVGELARSMGVKAGEIIRKLMDSGMMATINQLLDADTASLLASDFGYNVENVAFNAESMLEVAKDETVEDATTPRPPVVTIMGHVDHGKTSLLDRIRSTSVTDQEAGGITQHIGAYSVDVDGRRVTFLDTPGHEAFTAMRARGAKVTDIVVLLVAADDGVMPQTIEAINHARAAEVPILVAMNKMDKPGIDLEKLRKQLADNGLVAEEWGGDTVCVPVSAKTGDGVPHLLEMLLLQADILDLKANPEKLARGTIVEAKLDRGRGPVATVLVQEGTLNRGDPFVCGGNYGRVRAMIDDKGQRVETAGPSMPVEILGLQGVPDAGTVFIAVADEATARQVADHRREKQRDQDLVKSAKVSLEDLYKQVNTGDVKELKLVVKADVQGSVEAVTDALVRLSTEEVRVNVIHGSVGGVTESDALLASASNAVVIAFNVRPESKANSILEREGVDVRTYTVIYDALNDVRAAMEGMLEPTFREKTVGRAEVREVFSIPDVGVIAGSYVLDGKITRNATARLVRDSVVVYTGKIASLRRFKDDAREVTSGYECGIGLEDYPDIKSGDVIEVFEQEAVERRLSAPTAGRTAAA